MRAKSTFGRKIFIALFLFAILFASFGSPVLADGTPDSETGETETTDPNPVDPTPTEPDPDESRGPGDNNSGDGSGTLSPTFRPGGSDDGDSNSSTFDPNVDPENPNPSSGTSNPSSSNSNTSSSTTKPPLVFVPPQRPTTSSTSSRDSLNKTISSLTSSSPQASTTPADSSDPTEPTDAASESEGDSTEFVFPFSSELLTSVASVIPLSRPLTNREYPWSLITFWITLVIILCAFAGIATALISHSANAKRADELAIEAESESEVELDSEPELESELESED